MMNIFPALNSNSGKEQDTLSAPLWGTYPSLSAQAKRFPVRAPPPLRTEKEQGLAAGWGLAAKGAACPGALQLREQSEVSGESSGGGSRGGGGSLCV